jgi:hypothetical protein
MVIIDMGYIIDFVFGEHVNDHDMVYEKISKVCLIMNEEGSVNRPYEWFLMEFDPPIILWNRQYNEIEKKNRAQIRISWAVTTQKVKDVLRYLLDLSVELECRLFDGQIHEYITEYNISKVCKSHENGSSLVNGNVWNV